MDRTALRKWTRAANALPAVPAELPLPLTALADDSLDLARFAERYWEPEVNPTGGVVRPGLSVLDGKRGLSSRTAAEILELQDALIVAAVEYRLHLGEGAKASRRRAQESHRYSATHAHPRGS